MPRFLPLRSSVEWLKKTAKDRHAAMCLNSGNAKLHEAQLEVAREYGFPSWRAMIEHVELVRDKLRAAFPALNSPATSTNKPVDPDDPDLCTFLAAIREGDMTKVLQLLAIRPELATAHGPQGQTPLHVAAECNDSRLAIVLLAHDADPDATWGESGHTALSWAATCNAMDFANTLLRLAARPDLYTAAGVGSLKLVQAFFDDVGTLLRGSSRTGSSRFDSNGKRLSCPPELPVEQISDALSIAGRNGQALVVQFLLTKEIDLRFRAYMGATPLHWAYFSGSQTTIDMVSKAGADPTLRDDVLHCTPRAFGLCAAASWGLLFKVKSLLEQDCTLLNFTDGQTSALHEAVASKKIEVVRFLLDAGADRTIRDLDGKTASERAEVSSNVEIARLFGAG